MKPPRILLLAPCAPWPPDTGRTQRTHILHRALSRIGRVDTLILPPPRDEERSLLESEFGLLPSGTEERRAALRLFARLRRRPSKTLDFLVHLLRYHPRMYRPDDGLNRLVAELVRQNGYDLIVGRYSLLACKASAFRHAPLIVDIDDVDYMIPQTEAEYGDTPWPLAAYFRHCARRIEPIVQDFWKRCAHLWLANAADAVHVGSDSVRELPNIPFSRTGEIQPCPPNDSSRTILLVAHARWYPNRDGIERFLREAWPRVLKRCPDAKLQIAGKAAAADAGRWRRHKGVGLLGFVDDLRQAYAGAAFTVAPIFVGGGTKIKVLESLAYGRACVVTPHSHRGHEESLPDTKAVLRQDTPAGLADACCRLLEDPATRRDLAEFGAEVVRNRYSRQRVDEIVEATVEGVLRRREAA